MTNVEQITQNILQTLLLDFKKRNLNETALNEGYEGLNLEKMKGEYALGMETDFDLAIKDLENGGLVETGPMVPYENSPDSNVMMAGLCNKREYIFMKEKGYRAAENKFPKKRGSSTAPKVNISGGNFYSQVGIGADVDQNINIHVGTDAEVLLNLLERDNAKVTAEQKQQVDNLIETTKKGDIKEAKPLFKKLFGTAVEGTKAIAWGVVTEILKKQFGF